MNQSWPFKDIDARPAIGRFFPISFAEAVRAANEWQMIDPYWGRRVRICFLNPDQDNSEPLLLGEYRPEQALFLYSWPEHVVASAAKKTVIKSFQIFAPLHHICHPHGQSNFRGSYLVRLEKDGQLLLTECRRHFQQGRYGRGQGFSTALKKRLTRIEEKDVPLPIDVGSYLEPLDLDDKEAV